MLFIINYIYNNEFNKQSITILILYSETVLILKYQCIITDCYSFKFH